MFKAIAIVVATFIPGAVLATVLGSPLGTVWICTLVGLLAA